MRGFVSRVDLVGRAIFNALGLFARETWLDSNAVTEPVLWAGYLDADDVFPGGVRERAVLSFEWQHRVTAPRRRLEAPLRMWVRGKWNRCQQGVGVPVSAFMRSVSGRMDIVTGPQVATEYALDFWKVGYPQEASYVRVLSEVRCLIQV